MTGDTHTLQGESGFTAVVERAWEARATEGTRLLGEEPIEHFAANAVVDDVPSRRCDCSTRRGKTRSVGEGITDDGIRSPLAHGSSFLGSLPRVQLHLKVPWSG